VFTGLNTLREASSGIANGTLVQAVTSLDSGIGCPELELVVACCQISHKNLIAGRSTIFLPPRLAGKFICEHKESKLKQSDEDIAAWALTTFTFLFLPRVCGNISHP
jgi:hypothetical protein